MNKVFVTEAMRIPPEAWEASWKRQEAGRLTMRASLIASGTLKPGKKDDGLTPQGWTTTRGHDHKPNESCEGMVLVD